MDPLWTALTVAVTVAAVLGTKTAFPSGINRFLTGETQGSSPSETPPPLIDRSLLDVLPGGVFVLDDQRRFVYANPVLCRLLEVPCRELLGRSINPWIDRPLKLRRWAEDPSTDEDDRLLAGSYTGSIGLSTAPIGAASGSVEVTLGRFQQGLRTYLVGLAVEGGTPPTRRSGTKRRRHDKNRDRALRLPRGLKDILIVGATPDTRTRLRDLFRSEGLRVRHVPTPVDAMDELSSGSLPLPDVILLGRRFPGRLRVRDFYAWLRDRRPDLAGRVVLLDHGTVGGQPDLPPDMARVERIGGSLDSEELCRVLACVMKPVNPKNDRTRTRAE